ncbi:MAG: tRNA lysidine(34) synthetase TilS [Coprococcus sp.]|nr:tRNA lysidine(34) synthetase TilS [Coprococcus sp.]
MQKKVQKYIEQHHMIQPGDTVIAGVSGGADSICLLCVLVELSKALGFHLVVVHVNHGIRGAAADADEAYVQERCAAWSIPCETFHRDVPAFAKEHRISEEEAGRTIRRGAFEDAVRRHGGDRIALAHQMEDNAETFLLNLARGSRIKGLGGIRPVNGVYIRPLLCVGRQEIEQYLEKKGIAYCMDATNLEDTYTRNRIRSHVIPYLIEEVNERTVEHINGAMEELRKIQDYLAERAEEAFQRCVLEREDGYLIGKEALEGQEELLRSMTVRMALARLAGGVKDLEEIHAKAILELMGKQSGRKAILPYGICAVRTYGGVLLRKSESRKGASEGKKALEGKEDPEGKEMFLDLYLNQEKTFQYGEWTISCRILQNVGNMDDVPKKKYTKWFDYDIIKQNVSIRARRPGDWIVIDRNGNSQKLKSYFINEKIPADIRSGIPLIAEGDQILWIVGYRQSKAYQVTKETTSILEISVVEECTWQRQSGC